MLFISLDVRPSVIRIRPMSKMHGSVGAGSVLSFRVVNAKGETRSSHATRVDATRSVLHAVSTVSGQAFTIEGMPTTAGDVLAFKSVL